MDTHDQDAGPVSPTSNLQDLIWFIEQCRSNVQRLEAYIQNAERVGDAEVADCFRLAQGASRKGARQAEEKLRRRLAAVISPGAPQSASGRAREQPDQQQRG